MFALGFAQVTLTTTPDTRADSFYARQGWHRGTPGARSHLFAAARRPAPTFDTATFRPPMKNLPACLLPCAALALPAAATAQAPLTDGQALRADLLQHYSSLAWVEGHWGQVRKVNTS